MIDLSQVGTTVGPVTQSYTWRDVVLYHLGIGARATDLHLVYERAPGGLKVCPTYAVIPAFNPLLQVLECIKIDLKTVLHGEEAIRLHGPIPAEGTFQTRMTVTGVYDKRKAALVVLDTQTTDGNGSLLFETRASLFCRGLGGWGGDPGPKTEPVEIPADRKPDFTVSSKTCENQAALYRLCGDTNPLHIDPQAARAAGFDRPILHGLCTYGFVGRAILEGACGNDPGRLKAFQARFSDVVFPGDTITTRGWHMGGGVFHLEAATERARVLTSTKVEIAPA